MTDNSAIKVTNLTKIYHLYNSNLERLKESLHPLRRKYHRDFYALNNVSFEINKGETVGIVGKNGAGKSTLLKIITGVLTPTSGSVQVAGNVSALLELGAGFNQELSGFDNIYFNGMLMGYSRKDMDNRLDDILSFADIGEFVNQPVKTYSSGMFVRLAFSVAINVSPDILIVDEALSVGDMFFQAKCMAKLKKMIDSGITLIFVSHDTGSVKSICQKAILLQDGNIIDYNKADKVVEKYFSTRLARQQFVLDCDDVFDKATIAIDSHDVKVLSFDNNHEFVKRAGFERVRNGKADFKNVQLLDVLGNEVQSVDYGQEVILRMSIAVYEDAHLLGCGYHIQTKNGVSIINSNLNIEDKLIVHPEKGDRYCIDWKFKLCLMEGLFNVQCVMSIPLNSELGEVDFCDYIPCALQFTMQRRMDSRLYGYVHLDSVVEVARL